MAKRENWKIYINCGYEDEYKQLDSMEFKTRKEAEAAAKQGIDYVKHPGGEKHHCTYSARCVMRKSEWEKRKGDYDNVCMQY